VAVVAQDTAEVLEALEAQEDQELQERLVMQQVFLEARAAAAVVELVLLV
jgi:hypothetical protein